MSTETASLIVASLCIALLLWVAMNNEMRDATEKKREDRIERLLSILYETEPDSEEEQKILTLLDEMSLSHDEWVGIYNHNDGSKRPRLQERRLKSLDPRL